MKLIPNDISVTEQFEIYNRFIEMVIQWDGRYPFDPKHINTKRLLKESGVKCYHVSNANRLAGFEIVDHKKYMVFVLKYARG